MTERPPTGAGAGVRGQEPGARRGRPADDRRALSRPRPAGHAARRLSGALLVGGLALLAFLAAWLAVGLAAPPACDIGAEEDLGCARGFHARERDGRGSFRWTDGAAVIRLHGAGYGAPRVAELTLAAPRPGGGAPPALRLRAGGHTHQLTPSPAPRRYHVLLPPGFPAGDVASLSLTSATFRPPDSVRDLGVQVYDARLLATPAARLPGPLSVLGLLGLALAICVAAGPAARSPAAALAGAGAVVLAALLWAWLPARSLAFLPALALVAGLAAAVLRGRGAAGLLALPPVGLALLLNALLDAAIVARAVPRDAIVVALLAQAGLTVWAVRRALPHPAPLAALLAVALAVRLLALAARLLAGHGASDPDTELFFAYGRATIELGVPLVEYPSGALIPWALLALPDSRELFALLLPLLNLLCDLATVAGIWWLGRPADGPPSGAAGALALCYALSPLLLPFWHTKYDPLPAALLVLGLAAFARGRPGWAGAALGLGGAIKWVPWLAGPLLLWALLRPQPRWGWAARLVGGGLAAVALASLPFALRDLPTFLAPYTLQGGRPIIGESIWFLPALLLEPGLLAELPAPWSGVRDAPIPGALTVLAQLGALGGLALLLLLRPADRRRAVVLAALAPALFLLLNRVFSPQYMLIISACALAAAAPAADARQAGRLVALLALAQCANLLVWPNTVGYWPLASLVMFAAALSAVALVLAPLVAPQRRAGVGRPIAPQPRSER